MTYLRSYTYSTSNNNHQYNLIENSLANSLAYSKVGKSHPRTMVHIYQTYLVYVSIVSQTVEFFFLLLQSHDWFKEKIQVPKQVCCILVLFMLIVIDLYLRHSTLERTPVVYLYKGFLTFKTNHMQRRAVIVHAHSARQHSSLELN